MIKTFVVAVLWVIAALICERSGTPAIRWFGIGFVSLAVITIAINLPSKDKKVFFSDKMVVKAFYTFCDVKSLTPLAVLETVLHIPSQEVFTDPDQELHNQLIRNAGEDWLYNNVKPHYEIMLKEGHQNVDKQ